MFITELFEATPATIPEEAEILSFHDVVILLKAIFSMVAPSSVLKKPEEPEDDCVRVKLAMPYPLPFKVPLNVSNPSNDAPPKSIVSINI